ncbi:MAG TPA: ROK family protein [Terriglobales bacterium]|jgi:polyphosphate glucokinase|nr:ROK family protein [Terriglobales bacterium]
MISNNASSKDNSSNVPNSTTKYRVLAIDIGGTNVKLLASGQKEMRKVPSGPTFTARDMVSKVKAAVKDWPYDVISIGYPGPVVQGRPISEPFNLSPGWVKFDFRKAFGKPVKVINDAAMQALGSYKKGRMLFLGLGTGLGSAMIVDGVLQPMELAHLPYKKGRTYEDYLGLRGLERLGQKKWQKNVFEAVAQLKQAVQADDVVLGGGNAKKLTALPAGVRLGSNDNAFLGGFRMWQDESVRHGIVRTAGSK